MTPLEELQHLDSQVELVNDLEGLKPIFYRVEEIGKQNGANFEVQSMIGSIKHHLVARGMRLKELGATGSSGLSGIYGPPQTAQPPMQPPPPPPPSYPPQQFGPPPEGLPTAAIQVPYPPPDPGGQMPMGGAPMQPPPPPMKPPKKKSGGGWQRAVLFGGVIAVLLFGAFIAVIQIARKKNFPVKEPPPAAGVAVEINTSIPGASVRIDNDEKCKSNCKINLQPGNYQIMAMLDGYEPVASGVTVTTTPVTVNMPAFAPIPQALRLLPELDGAKYVLDDQPPADLPGEITLDKVAVGKHSVKVTGKTGEASFSFTSEPGKAPVLDSAPTARNLLAILVSSGGGAARVYASGAVAKISLDGQPQGETSPTGLDLKNATPGEHELQVGEGKDQRKLVITVGSAPTLAAYLKSDLNIGTLVVVTGEDEVTVIVNGKEQRKKTQRGQLRIPTIGNVKVSVTKPGFQNEPEQTAVVKKGEEAKLEFKLRSLPKVAALQIRNGMPGTLVLVERQPVGRVASDGSLTASNIPPGDHGVELQREGFAPRRLQKTFKAGETLLLTPAEIALTSASGVLRIKVTPADATVTMKRSDEQQARAVREPSLTLNPGRYLFSARANGYAEQSVTVDVTAGETRNVDITLNKLGTGGPVTPPVKQTGGFFDYFKSEDWTKDGDLYVHRGAGLLVMKQSPVNGTITFTIQKTKNGGFGFGRIRWVVNYTGGKDYAQFELDKKKFYPLDVVDGKQNKRETSEHGLTGKAYTIQIDVSPDRIVHRVPGGAILDSWTEAGRNFTQGRFGIKVDGSDEIAISDFKYTPR